MKRVINFLVSGAIVLGTQTLMAQSADDSKMNRDLEISENILSTLIKQEFDKRNFFPVEVRGSYRPGYGVTFTIPTSMLLPMTVGNGENVFILDGTPGVYSYSYSSGESGDARELEVLEGREAEKERVSTTKAKENATKDKEKAGKEKEKANKEIAEAQIQAERAQVDKQRYRTTVGRATDRPRKNQNTDSIRAVNNAKIILAAKNFLADYGDLLGQLKADEKIIITNKDNNQRFFYVDQSAKRSILIIEVSKGDITQYRQNKITREGLLSKIKVTNTESTGKLEPDMELLTSIFNRLYSSDLSSNYYMSGNAYYERLTDFGAIVYMQVYSSNETNDGLFNMPTVDLREIDRAARDKKVKELYPTFESELKENILEYGRTVKSLKDNEQLVFNVVLTKCKGCGIPADLEVSVPNSVLKDYASGKVEKNSALSKVTVKKGAVQ